MQLSEFQARFKDLMLDNPKALDNPPQDIAAFCMEGDIPLSERLKVYRNNIVGSLTDVMLATFPMMEKLVGREFLEMMARSFILEHPPENGCLSTYGDGFAEFIEGFELAASLPYLPDVARYELAMNKAYYAADDMALTAKSLGQVPPEDLADLKLALRDNVHLIVSAYPLNALSVFVMQEHAEGQFDMGQGGDKLMVSRPQLETQTLILKDDEHLALTKLHNGVTLGEMVEQVLENFPEFDFQSFLQKHIALETFLALNTNI